MTNFKFLLPILALAILTLGGPVESQILRPRACPQCRGDYRTSSGVFIVQSPSLSSNLPAPKEHSVKPEGPVSTATEGSFSEADSSFHKALLKAAVQANRNGTINRAQLAKLRLALLSPAFRNKAETLAIIQIASSDQDGAPYVQYSEDGSVIRERIDWDGLINFLERLLPLILKIISIFSGL